MKYTLKQENKVEEKQKFWVTIIVILMLMFAVSHLTNYWLLNEIVKLNWIIVREM